MIYRHTREISIIFILTAFPYKLRHKILGPKYLIHQQFEIRRFIVINTDKDHTIVTQQIACQIQTRQHHVQPVAVVLAVFFAIRAKCAFAQHIAFVVFISNALQVFFFGLREFVGVDEGVAAGVVRRVDVDHFDLPKIAFL